MALYYRSPMVAAYGPSDFINNGSNPSVPASFLLDMEVLWSAIVDDELFDGGTGTDYTATPSEEVTVSEAIGVLRDASIALTEEPALADALTSAFAGLATIEEEVSLAELAAAGLSYLSSLGESVPLSDALAALYSTVVALAEESSLAEALAGGVSLTVQAGEEVTVSEVLAGAASFVMGLVDSLSLTDAVIAVGEYRPGDPTELTLRVGPSRAVIEVAGRIVLSIEQRRVRVPVCAGCDFIEERLS